MNELDSLLDVAFEFHRQPEPVSANLRPIRRVPLLLLLVAKSHGSGASWKALQVLSWAVRSDAHAELLASVLAGVDIPDRPIVRIEPALGRAIDMAVGLALLEQKASRTFRLTASGHALVASVEASTAFAHERQTLTQIKGKVTQREITRLLEWRDG